MRLFTLSVFALCLLPLTLGAANTDSGGYEVIANAFGFRIDIPGCAATAKAVTEVSFADMTVDVTPEHLPGDVHFGPIRITAEVPSGGGQDLDAWLVETLAGEKARRKLRVTLKRKDGSPGRLYTALGCVLTSLIHVKPTEPPGPPEEPALDSVVFEVQPQRIEFESPSKQSEDPPPATTPSSSRSDEYVRNTGFRVDFNPDDAPQSGDPGWKSARGGGIRFVENADTTTGDDDDHLAPLGKRQWKDLELAGPLTAGREDMTDLLSGQAQGKRRHKPITVTEVNVNDRGEFVPGRSYLYRRAFPVRYVFPKLCRKKVDGTFTEAVTFHGLRIVPELAQVDAVELQIPGAQVASVSAADVVLHDLSYDTTNVPNGGEARVQTLDITVPAAAAAEFKQWIDKPELREILITFLPVPKKGPRSYHLVGCIPVDLEPVELESTSPGPLEVLHISVQRVEVR